MDQVRKLVESNLLQKTRRIYASILGQDDYLAFHPSFLQKLRVRFRHINFKLYEFPTLQLLEEVCRRENCQVWYIHAKGTSKPGSKYEEDWRCLMEYFILEHWQLCTQALEHHDAVGIMWRPRGDKQPHFSGNFWWANSSYIRRLPPVKSLNHQDRYQAETWIGMSDPKTVADLYPSVHCLFGSSFLRSQYPDPTLITPKTHSF